MTTGTSLSTEMSLEEQSDEHTSIMNNTQSFPATNEMTEIINSTAHAITQVGTNFETVKYIYLLVLPMILIGGVTGNTLSFLTMRRGFMIMRKTTACVFILVLAVSDNIMILSFIPRLVILIYSQYAIDINVYTRCIPGSALLHGSAQYSAWMIVCLAADRFLHVHFPSRAKTLCTLRRAWSLCATIAITLVLLNGYFWVSFQVHIRNGFKLCQINPALKQTWAIVDSLFYTYIPSPLIILLLAPTIYKLWAYRGHQHPEFQVTPALKATRRVTAILILVCVLFVSLTLPVMTYWYWIYTPSYEVDVLFAVFISCYVFNHSINFLLYCASVKKFRMEVRALFRRNQVASSSIE